MWVLCSRKPPQHREGQFLVPRAWLSPGFLSAAVGRRVAPVAYVHSRKRPDPRGAGLAAARRVALETRRVTTAVLTSYNHQSSSLTSNDLPNPKKRLSGPLSLCNYFQSAASPLPTQPIALPVGPLGEGGGSATQVQ